MRFDFGGFFIKKLKPILQLPPKILLISNGFKELWSICYSHLSNLSYSRSSKRSSLFRVLFENFISKSMTTWIFVAIKWHKLRLHCIITSSFQSNKSSFSYLLKNYLYDNNRWPVIVINYFFPLSCFSYLKQAKLINFYFHYSIEEDVNNE